ncbi:MAG TPA: flagellar basal body-associated FliL family protein, partial [Solirubrobacteraceae bacterium]|nr:flagellar basal body-associated FliL family protein [Solirubrobacteraceae bacterium]
MKKLKSKKILILLPVILVLGAMHAMAKPKPTAKPKIAGTIYQLPKEFLVNLRDGHFAKLSLALILAPGQSDGAAPGASASSSEGVGTLPEEGAIRDIVTSLMTGESQSDLIDEHSREDVKHRILSAIRTHTD